MSEMALQKNIGAYISGVLALIPNTIISGDAIDGVEQNGEDFDKNFFTNETVPHMSAELMIPFAVGGGSTGSTELWTITVQLQDGDTTAAYTDVTLKDQSTSFSGTAPLDTDNAVNGVLRVSLDTAKLKRHFRVQINTEFSGSSSTAIDIDIAAVFVAGGSNILPPA